jgi:hypothetical protein
MRSRKGWIGAGLAVVVIAIAAVILAQGSGSDGGPLNAIAKAAEVTQREPGGRAYLRENITSSTTPEGLTETGSVTFDENGRARGTMTVRGHSTGKEVKVTAIAVGTTAYTSSDELDSIPEGKKWMKIDFSAAVDGPSPSAAASGPQEGLKVLEKVQGAEKVGEEKLDGVPTTHYVGTLPATEEIFGAKIDSSAPHVEVWIDQQDRVRRMQVNVRTSVNEDVGQVTTDMTIDFVEFGRVPNIEPPPQDEVFDATSEFESEVRSAAAGH